MRKEWGEKQGIRWWETWDVSRRELSSNQRVQVPPEDAHSLQKRLNVSWKMTHLEKVFFNDFCVEEGTGRYDRKGKKWSWRRHMQRFFCWENQCCNFGTVKERGAISKLNSDLVLVTGRLPVRSACHAHLYLQMPHQMCVHRSQWSLNVLISSLLPGLFVFIFSVFFPDQYILCLKLT